VISCVFFLVFRVVRFVCLFCFCIQLWVSELRKSGALGKSQVRQSWAESDGESLSGKRRKRQLDASTSTLDKRIRTVASSTGPKINVPLTYPTLRMTGANTTNNTTNTNTNNSAVLPLAPGTIINPYQQPLLAEAISDARVSAAQGGGVGGGVVVVGVAGAETSSVSSVSLSNVGSGTTDLDASLTSELLGPGDDDSDSEEIPTNNLIVCQYEKVSHSKNKWKLQLKDGIMHIEGRDYVFSKAVGEVDW